MSDHDPQENQTPTPKKQSKTTFAGDVIKLVTGTSFAQLLTVLSAPILTRLYSPADFGILAVFISTTDILGVIACLRYEMAIVLPEEDDKAANLFGLSLMFAVSLSILTIPLVFFGRSLFLTYSKFQKSHLTYGCCPFQC